MSDEKWGCWDGMDEIVSAVADSKEEAIQEYVDGELSCDLDEDETGEHEATLSVGSPVLIANHLPSFKSLCEHIEQSAYDESNIDDELLNMTPAEEQEAEEAYDRMLAEFAAKYLKQRDWSVFGHPQRIMIKIEKGEYVSFREVSDAKP